MRDALSFALDETGKRYSALLDGVEVAYMEVDPIGTDAMLIKHTEVPAVHEGKGYGSAIVRQLLDEMRAQDKTVVPICPFAASYMKRHPETLDLVRPSYRAAMK
jgi:predicted GNAT family acetyltransferase